MKWPEIAKSLFVCVTMIISLSLCTALPSVQRSKRNLLQFGQMLSSLNDKTFWRMLIEYGNYGCFCGAGHVGDNPTDEVDKCCQIHDYCYHALRTKGCNPYRDFYTYTQQNNGLPVCVPEENQKTYLIFNRKCLYETCKCDTEAALCISQHPVNKQYVQLDRLGCDESPPSGFTKFKAYMKIIMLTFSQWFENCC